MNTSPRSTGLLRLTPTEYLHHALRGLDKFGFHAVPSLVVRGDIALDGRQSNSLRIASLPPARVMGNVTVRSLASLESCALEVEGNLEIGDCPNLTRLSGRAATAIIDGAGLESVGADFECREDMKIRGTHGLSRLNCKVGRTLFVKGAVEVTAGPAFSCWGLVLDGGASLIDAAGNRLGGLAFGPPQLIQGARLPTPRPHTQAKTRSRRKGL